MQYATLTLALARFVWLGRVRVADDLGVQIVPWATRSDLQALQRYVGKPAVGVRLAWGVGWVLTRAELWLVGRVRILLKRDL